VAAVDLAKLWNFADRLLIPRLQNMVMDQLGCPDFGGVNLFTMEGEQKPVLAVLEFIDYVGISADNEKSLGRYCVRLLLIFFACENTLRRGNDEHIDLTQRNMRAALGNRVASGLIIALMRIFGEQNMELPAWNIEDYYVQENIGD
jgi:hypothetical protein